LALIDITDLTVTYDGRPILDGIDLCIERGERLCIVGGNGSGKSSLAHAAAGWLTAGPHMAGTILYDGRAPADLPLAERTRHVQHVGQVPMHQLSGRAFTVVEEVAFGPENLNWPVAEARRSVDDALDRLRLGHLADRDPFTLSGGEQQRLSIAAALALDPAVLILDEPGANLDVAARQQLVAELVALPSDRALLLFDVEPALGLALGCRLLDLVDGRLREHVPASRQVFAQPVLPAVRSAAAPFLAMETVTFAYPGARPLYTDLSVSVAAGEAVALVGPNGIGKSTLFRLAAGLSRPSSGSIRIGNSNIANLGIDEIARDVATVFQEPENQLFSPTVRDEVAFGLDALGLGGDEIEQRLDAALDRTGLQSAAARHPLDLDAAARRFVTIACALARQPALILLDEVQRGLDQANTARMETIIADERARGAAILFICHAPAFVARNASRLIDLADHVAAAAA
jgi:energy-coupling factor transporter ATP-binding protein EcfA2